MFRIFLCFCPKIKELLMIKKCKQTLLSANDANNCLSKALTDWAKNVTKTLIYSSKVKTLLINLVVIIKTYHQLSFKGCMMTETIFFHYTFTWFRTWAPVASLKFEKMSQLHVNSHVLQIELNDHISIMILVKLWINHNKFRIILSCFKFKMLLSKTK